jgi:hypothetical protein
MSPEEQRDFEQKKADVHAQWASVFDEERDACPQEREERHETIRAKAPGRTGAAQAEPEAEFFAVVNANAGSSSQQAIRHQCAATAAGLLLRRLPRARPY